MRFSLMILSVTAVLAADFAMKNVSVGRDGTLWFETIDVSPQSRAPSMKLPAPKPDAVPVIPSHLPATPVENLPSAPELWNFDEYV
jgi:hypothetical protein